MASDLSLNWLNSAMSSRTYPITFIKTRWVSTISVGPSFGLLFGDLLKELGVETTGASLVMSTMEGVSYFSGLIVGALTKKYSYRKVAILGAALCTTAFLSTAPANSMLHIMITYAVIGGIGVGLANSSTLVVINEYFTKKKGQAIALSMTGTVVGFMLMPQIVRFLLDEYDFRSALLIIGALSLHAVVGAYLFQPVSWHKKAVMVEEEEAHTLLLTDKKDNPASTDTANGVKSNVSWPTSEERNSLLDIPSKDFSPKKSLIQHSDGAGNTLYIQVCAYSTSMFIINYNCIYTVIILVYF
ncbi:unnamed protein product [Nezara viridula]|uniref:Major facilitator superfamily (MFS) profile domain-containing protein n=1 Tax=Nezara viridula TaxID=85310 RepID=A0A9P0HDR8_NEZVI|nr:unnamed protein product [Nezara viridula]